MMLRKKADRSLKRKARLLPLCILALLVGGAGCTSRARPDMKTQADTLAMRMYDFAGGPRAWQSVKHLRFDFAASKDGQRQPARRHLWNRQTGDYRLEWPAGDDSTYVALFNVNSEGSGRVFLNGHPVASGRSDSLLHTARRIYTNDSYWLLAPTKAMDSGAKRSVVADSSSGSTAVLHLTFGDNVGMTPGDEYWLYANRETGRLKKWRFKLQGGNKGHFRWTDYRSLDAPVGSVRVATRKKAIGGPFSILTDHVGLPSNPPDSLFSASQPLLQ